MDLHEPELRNLAVTYLGLNADLSSAIQLLDELRQMNARGIVIDWPNEKVKAEYGWALSVGQELSEKCGGIDNAVRVLKSL